MRISCLKDYIELARENLRELFSVSELILQQEARKDDADATFYRSMSHYVTHLTRNVNELLEYMIDEEDDEK